jgi:hypothetical protein
MERLGARDLPCVMLALRRLIGVRGMILSLMVFFKGEIRSAWCGVKYSRNIWTYSNGLYPAAMAKGSAKRAQCAAC